MPVDKDREQERAKLRQGTGEEAKVANKTMLASRLLQSVFLSKFRRDYKERRFSLKRNGTRDWRVP